MLKQFMLSPPYFPHYQSIKFSWWRKPGPMGGGPTPWAEFKGSQFWGGPIQDWLIHSRGEKNITLLIPKTISISFDTSVQSHFHGQPHHCLVCSNSSALVLNNLENIKGAGQSGNQITANVKQGFSWVVDGMVKERVPLFDALIRNFPALLRRAQSSATPTRTVIKESARKADQASLLPLILTHKDIPSVLKAYHDGYSTHRWHCCCIYPCLWWSDWWWKQCKWGLKWVCSMAFAWVTKHNWQKILLLGHKKTCAFAFYLILSRKYKVIQLDNGRDP